MAEARITGIAEAPGQTMDRAGKMDMVVAYSIDGSPAGSVRVPLESYTTEKALEMIKDRLRQWMAVVDKPITL